MADVRRLAKITKWPPSIDDWNAIVEYLVNNYPHTGAAGGEIGVSMSGGRAISILDEIERKHWAKLTAKDGNNYAHIYAVPNGDGTFTDMPAGTTEGPYAPGFPGGTTEICPAHEVNGVDVDLGEDGVYVELTPGDAAYGTCCFLFSVGDGGLQVYPAELTSTYTSGYSWKRMTVTTGTWAEYEPTVTGDYNAYSPDNNQDLEIGTRGVIFPDGDKFVFVPVIIERTHCVNGFLHRQTSIDGGITWEDDPTGPQEPQITCGSAVPDAGCDGTGWSWTQGLLHLPDRVPPFTECLNLTVVSVAGFCGDIVTTQELHLRTEDGVTWTSQAWDCDPAPGEWLDEDFECDPDTGPAVFTKGGDTPSLQLCGVTRKLDVVCGSRDGKVVVFEGGGAEFCDGTTPADKCLDNTFIVKLECVCCSIDGWMGPGWYRVLGEGETCDSQCDGTVVELIEADRCDSDIVICSCRFDTQTEANDACGGSISCSSDPDCTDYALPATIYAVTSGGNGNVTLNWDAGNSRWEGSAALACGETLHIRFTTTCSVTFSCNGTDWGAVSSAGVDVCTGGFESAIYTANMDDTFAGCSVGSCGSIDFQLFETLP